MSALRIALLQMTSGIDAEANAGAIAAAIDEAAAAGAAILFTPEMSGRLDRDRARLLAAALPEADDPVLAQVRAGAARHGLWVALGSLALRSDTGGDRLVNRSLLIDDAGAVRARYDKLHLFDVDVADGHRYRESATFAAGSRAVLAQTPWGALGLSVCYDLRFPRLFEALTGAGATLLAVPAAFTRPTGTAHWHTLLRARAIEAGAFVIAAAQTGLHADGRETYGHSLVVDPWGTVLLDMGIEPGLACIDIDLDAVAATRARIPAIDHRRDFVLDRS